MEKARGALLGPSHGPRRFPSRLTNGWISWIVNGLDCRAIFGFRVLGVGFACSPTDSMFDDILIRKIHTYRNIDIFSAKCKDITMRSPTSAGPSGLGWRGCKGVRVFGTEDLSI